MATRERTAPKTWSLLGDVKRRPSVYEVTAAKFVHHFRREPAPFEMGPEAPLNQWYLKYREGSEFNVEDWEGFHDPAKLTYSEYVTLQHDRETYLDGLIDHHEEAATVEGYDKAWVETLNNALVPLRFPLHILQMLSLYTGQMGPSAFIINCANFQAADEMREIQRFAYLTKWMANAHGAQIADSAAARAAWENGAAWQPMRKALEELLGVYDWGESLVVLQLVMKPTMDSLINDSLGELAATSDDELLALMLAEFNRDAQRSKDWTAELTRYAIANNASLKGTISDWVAKWTPAANAMAEGYAALLPGMDSAKVVETAAKARAALQSSAGL